MRLIIGDYDTYIEHYQGKENWVADSQLTFPINDNQMNTHKYSYEKEIMSETNYIKELTEDILPINLRSINQY